MFLLLGVNPRQLMKKVQNISIHKFLPLEKLVNKRKTNKKQYAQLLNDVYLIILIRENTNNETMEN